MDGYLARLFQECGLKETGVLQGSKTKWVLRKQINIKHNDIMENGMEVPQKTKNTSTI